MIQSQRAFLEGFIARMEPRITLYREMPDRLSWNIAGAIEREVARDRAILATLPPDDVAAAPVAAVTDPVRVTWKHPVFNVGGRFNPWAGTYAQAMLASADVCDRMGYPEIGDGYRARAAACGDASPDAGHVMVEPSVAIPVRRRPRSVWLGPAMPPPEPTPFVAGEQMGFAL